MKRINLDSAAPAVKQFVEGLVLEPGGVELELGGTVIGKVIGPHQLSDDERDALLAEGWELVRQSQERNRGVSARVIEREVQKAIDEVRQRNHG